LSFPGQLQPTDIHTCMQFCFSPKTLLQANDHRYASRGSRFVPGSPRPLKTMQIQKMSFFSQKVAYVRPKLGQNQGLWSQNGDTMSLGLGGVFQPVKKVT